MKGLVILLGSCEVSKTNFADKLAKDSGFTLVTIGNKVNDIREMIDNCYTTNLNILYYIPDGDNLTTQSQNALLKISEEPPMSSAVIISSEKFRLLNTLKSRGVVYHINPPTKEELQLYTEEKINVSQKGYIDDIVSISTTFEDIDLITKYDVKEFLDFCNKVIDNIFTVSDTNSFKILHSLDLKGDSTDKYNIELFLKTIKELLCVKIQKEADKYLTNKYLDLYWYTNDTLNSVGNGVNKQQLMDYWLMNVRRDWVS